MRPLPARLRIITAAGAASLVAAIVIGTDSRADKISGAPLAISDEVAAHEAPRVELDLETGDLAASLRDWSHDVHQLVDRVAARGAVIERSTRKVIAHFEAWVHELAGVALADHPLPDLSPLTATPVRGIESSGFGWRDDPVGGGRKFHKGADYRADRGTPVYAAGDGVVVFAGRQNGYGKVIYLDHGGGVVTRYAHLRDIGVDKGDAVAADTQIGEVGSTGRTTGPHLHFEVRIDGRAVNPDIAREVAEVQRSGDETSARLAALALVPEVQKQSLDRHDPRNRNLERAGRRAGRPERRGRGKRSRPTS